MKFLRLLTQSAAAAACLSALAMAMPAQAQNKPLKLAWIASVNSPQIAVALDKELWKQRGLDVSVINFATGREGLEALMGGQVDLVSMAEFPAATAAARGQKLGIIADLSRNNASRVVTTTDYPTLKSLEGRKLGTTVGTNVHYQLEAALEAAGVKGSIVNAGPADLVPSLARKDVDAVTLFPSAIPRARQALGARYLEIATPEYVAHSLVAASEQALTDKQAELKLFVAGLIAADAIVEKTPAVAQQSIVATSRGGVLMSDLTQAWSDHEFRVVLRQDLLELIAQQSRWLSTKGMVKGTGATPDQLRGYVRADILRALDASRVTLK